MSKNSKTVMVSGGFDPLHVGHLELIRQASRFGDVIVALNSDEWLARKKGRPFMRFDDRAVIMSSLANVRRVVPVDDSDGTVCAAIIEHRPDYFANGGDRKLENTPENNVCFENNIEQLFGLGDKVRSSTDLTAKVPIERAWGRYTVLYNGNGFQVKVLEIDPGKATSLQRHQHRSEHWIWANDEHESHGAEKWHQLANNLNHPMHVIEVQTGSHFDEDDIERVPLSEHWYGYKIVGAIPTKDILCRIPDLQDHPGIWAHVLAQYYGRFVEYVDWSAVKVINQGVQPDLKKAIPDFETHSGMPFTEDQIRRYRK